MKKPLEINLKAEKYCNVIYKSMDTPKVACITPSDIL
jgi:hypothetical protein